MVGNWAWKNKLCGFPTTPFLYHTQARGGWGETMADVGPTPFQLARTIIKYQLFRCQPRFLKEVQQKSSNV